MRIIRSRCGTPYSGLPGLPFNFEVHPRGSSRSLRRALRLRCLSKENVSTKSRRSEQPIAADCLSKQGDATIIRTAMLVPIAWATRSANTFAQSGRLLAPDRSFNSQFRPVQRLRLGRQLCHGRRGNGSYIPPQSSPSRRRVTRPPAQSQARSIQARIAVVNLRIASSDIIAKVDVLTSFVPILGCDWPLPKNTT